MNEIPEIQFSAQNDLQVKDFEILNLKELINRPDFNSLKDHNPFTYHRMSFNALFIITAGEGKHLADLKTYHLVAGDCLLITKGRIQAFVKESNLDGYLILFTENFITQNFTLQGFQHLQAVFNGLGNIQKVNNKGENKPFIALLQKEISTTDKNIIEDVIGAHLMIFLLKITAQENKILTTQNKDSQLFERFRKLVEQDYSTSRNAKDYAQKLYISYKKLNELCKANNNRTAKQIIDNYIILEAKRFLASTNRPIKEISYQLGFNEPTNFQKFFKKHTNITTNQFRQSI